MKNLWHVNFDDLKAGMTLYSEDPSFYLSALFIKEKREYSIIFDIIKLSNGIVVLQYDDWETKTAWENEVHLWGRIMNEEHERIFVRQFFTFGLLNGNSDKAQVHILTSSELNKIPLSIAEEGEKRRYEKLKEKRY